MSTVDERSHPRGSAGLPRSFADHIWPTRAAAHRLHDRQRRSNRSRCRAGRQIQVDDGRRVCALDGRFRSSLDDRRAYEHRRYRRSADLRRLRFRHDDAEQSARGPDRCGSQGRRRRSRSSLDGSMCAARSIGSDPQMPSPRSDFRSAGSSSTPVSIGHCSLSICPTVCARRSSSTRRSSVSWTRARERRSFKASPPVITIR